MEDIRVALLQLMDVVNSENDEKVGYAISYLEDLEEIISNLPFSDLRMLLSIVYSCAPHIFILKADCVLLYLVLTRSIVLDRDTGLTRFCLSAAGKGKFLADECVKGLELLKNYVEKLGRDVAPFADHVQVSSPSTNGHCLAYVSCMPLLMSTFPLEHCNRAYRISTFLRKV